MGLHNKSVSLYDFVVVRDWIPRFNDLSRAKVDKVGEGDDVDNDDQSSLGRSTMVKFSHVYIFRSNDW